MSRFARRDDNCAYSNVTPFFAAVCFRFHDTVHIVNSVRCGTYPFSLNAFLFPLSLHDDTRTGGVTGRVLALFFVARYQRGSLLVLSLVTVLSCSIFIYMAYLIGSKKDFELSSLCS